MKIVVDAMGGDNAPGAIIEGSVRAINDIGVDIVLVGNKEIIEQHLKQHTFPAEKITIQHADEVITNDDSPTKVIKAKKNSSLVVGLNMLKRGQGDAFLSAGNTGALLAGALLTLGRIKGVDRPALTPVIPTDTGCALLIDAGANTNCKPINFLQFALMGTAYMNKVLDIPSPKVGLLNIGAEEGKGNDITKNAYVLLKTAPINFIGNIEAREIPYGNIDVVVCDGFVGNVVLKLMEGMGLTFYKNIKGLFTKNVFSYLAALFLRKGLKEFKKKMDYTEYGGAPLLGVKGAVIKAHGSSDKKAIYSAIRQAKKFVEAGVVENIKEYIYKTELDGGVRDE